MLFAQITDVLNKNGFEIENHSSSKSFSEYIIVIVRNEYNHINYRLKIRVSDHSLPRGGSLATADIRMDKTIEEAVCVIKKSHSIFEQIEIK